MSDLLVKRLFPSHSNENLANLSNKQLLELAQSLQSTAAYESHLPTGNATNESGSDGSDRGWNEARELGDPSRDICDEVNALSLTGHRQSYLGTSSVRAILRAIFKLRPALEADMRSNLAGVSEIGLVPVAQPSPMADAELQNAVPAVDEDTSVDGYFAHVHGLVPLIDEATFRATWKQGDRTRRPWLALLNMVLALGSLTVGDSDESSRIYYARAKPCFGLELMGHGSTESLQALCLLGGIYLHYKNAPNMAYTVMGSAHRIAISLGLHRQHEAEIGRGNEMETDKKRLWWSVFCLDTWGAMTLGRPSKGRWDPDTMHVLPATAGEKKDLAMLSLDSSRAFCMIATQIQQRFAQFTPLSVDDIFAYDDAVRGWFAKLPAVLLDSKQTPACLGVARDTMLNRYHNLRLLLYRPMLLQAADLMMVGTAPSLPEQTAIRVCRDVACDAINHIAGPISSPDSIRSWSGGWYLYQASLVLILGLMLDPNNPEQQSWRATLGLSIAFYEHAKKTSARAARSQDIIKLLLNSCQGEGPQYNLSNIQMGVRWEAPNDSILAQLGLDLLPVEAAWEWNAAWATDMNVYNVYNADSM